ncbi:MAG: PDZ domain-containing protein [Anaerolineaceae bacterium]|nr:MAG: PDZ domain-containing protein [Anaerolineaceae bacterium]
MAAISRSVRLWLAVALLILSACASSAPPAEVTPTFDVTDRDQPIPQALLDTADAERDLLGAVYTRLAPSVVAVEAVLEGGIVRRGSGFIYDRNGRIVTSAQTISGAEAVRVTFDDGLTVNATSAGFDAYSDVAVLRVDVPPARSIPVTFADSDAVQVGERAIVLGNPYGLSSSINSGIIGGIGRRLPSAALVDFGLPPGFQNPRILQTSVPVPQGGNGGVVLNSRGEVVGMAVEVTTAGGLYQGVGFAVPANTVRRVVPDLIRDGEVRYAWLGINTVQSDYGLASFARALSLATDSGVLVTAVTPQSPADEADLRGGSRYVDAFGLPVCAGGDIITAIDGTFISHIDDLVYYLLVNHIPGDVVTLLILRDGDPQEVSVTLAERPTTTPPLPPCGDASLPERDGTPVPPAPPTPVGVPEA